MTPGIVTAAMGERPTDDDLGFTRAFPMYVLPVAEVLALTRIRTHEEILDKLVVWTPGMGDAAFISQTWLGRSHPDPDGSKLHLLQKLLRKMSAGKFAAPASWLADAWYGPGKCKVAAASMSRIQYVWFDLWSVPQADPEQQKKAIQSIFSYVHDAAQFIVLAGAWQHEDGRLMDYRTWMRRGWCRLELLANAMSPTQKNVILAESATQVISHGPKGIFGQSWFSSSVGKGEFTVPLDRGALGPVINGMLNSRKEQALAKGDMTLYRFIHASTQYTLAGTGTEATIEETLDEWMAAMKLTSVHDGKRGTGLTPLIYAVCAGRADLCTELVRRGASIHAKIRKALPQFGLRKHMDAIHVASALHDNPAVINALLAAGANPFRQLPLSEASKGCVHHAVQFGHCGNIDALYEHSSRLMKQVDWAEFTTMQFTAFAMDAAKVHIVDGVEHDVTVDHVLSKYGTELGDVNATKGVGVNILCLTLTSVGSVATLRSLLDHGADPVYENPDMMKATNFINAMMVPFMGLCKLAVRLGSTHQMVLEMVWPYGPPLHSAAYVGNLGAVRLFLERGVDVNRRAKHTLYKPTALHLAALNGHEEVIKALLAAGADAHARDSRGKTPAQWAAKRGHETVAALLVSEGSATAETTDSLLQVEPRRLSARAPSVVFSSLGSSA